MFRIILLAALVGFVLAIKFFPWYGVVGFFIALYFTLKLAGGKALRVVFEKPFRIKGAVLHNATAQIHGIEPAPAPTVEPDDDEFEYDEDVLDLGTLEFFYVDLTITPKAASGPMTHWEPGELLLVAPDSDPEDLYDEDELSHVHDLELHDGGQFVRDEGLKCEGPRRVRLHVGVKPGTERLALRYYFEIFGSVDVSTAMQREPVSVS